MRAWHVLLVAIALSGLLAYRVVVLEARVTALSQSVQRWSEKLEGEKTAPSQALNDYDKRLGEVETRLAEVKKRLNESSMGETPLEKNAQAGLDKLLESKQFDERVLSVIDAETQRAMDSQLKWYRDAIVKYRMDALTYFAADQKLSSGQLSALRAILEDEVDRMVDILRTPELLADREKGLATWVEMIAQTDKDATEVLNEKQATVYRHLRRLEQQALTPWLPEKDRS